MKRISEEKRACINELKAAGLNNAQIAERTGVAAATVSRWLAKEAARKNCPVCRRENPMGAEASFCPYCGADIRTPGRKLVPRVEAIIKNISSVYPAHLRDEAIKTLNEVIKIIEEA